MRCLLFPLCWESMVQQMLSREALGTHSPWLIFPIDFPQRVQKSTTLPQSTYPVLSAFDGLENKTKTGYNNKISHYHYTLLGSRTVKFYILTHIWLDYIIKLMYTFTLVVSISPCFSLIKLFVNCFLYNPWNLKIEEICHLKNTKTQRSQNNAKKQKQSFRSFKSCVGRTRE